MKYYVILLVTFNDGTQDKVGIYNYDSEDAAVKGFFNYMRQYVGEDNVKTVNVEAKNNVGTSFKNESWTQPVA